MPAPAAGQVHMPPARLGRHEPVTCLPPVGVGTAADPALLLQQGQVAVHRAQADVGQVPRDAPRRDLFLRMKGEIVQQLFALFGLIL